MPPQTWQIELCEPQGYDPCGTHRNLFPCGFGNVNKHYASGLDGEQISESPFKCPIQDLDLHRH